MEVLLAQQALRQAFVDRTGVDPERFEGEIAALVHLYERGQEVAAHSSAARALGWRARVALRDPEVRRLWRAYRSLR